MYLSESWHVPDDLSVLRPDPGDLGHGRAPGLAHDLRARGVAEVHLVRGLLDEDGAARVRVLGHGCKKREGRGGSD